MEKEKVTREYAEWLEKPHPIEADIVSKVPLTSVTYLSERVRRNLLDSGISEFYPVQHKLVPFIVDTDADSSGVDVCCSAPTGSGKTLAYSIPLVELLKRSVCERYVAAVVILPVKDLVEQVASVIRRVARDTNVHCVLLSGDQSYEEECNALNDNDWRTAAERAYSTYFQRDCAAVSASESNAALEKESLQQRSGRQTVVVCTPSRLLLHMHRNAPICEALRTTGYLVIDEADRVLHDAVRSGWVHAFEHAVGVERFAHSATSWQLAGDFKSQSATRPLRKLLFSATFTRNPELLHAVRMHKPVLFAARAKAQKSKLPKKTTDSAAVADDANTDNVAETSNTAEAERAAALCRFVAPSGLHEYFVASGREFKPLALYLLLRTKLRKLCPDDGAEATSTEKKDGEQKVARKCASVLCFANSRESSQRLAHVLSKLGGDQLTVSELSARLPTAKRRRILAQLARNEIDVVVCTDALARGMDIGSVRCVVSYDLPAHAKTYVHRCGRTARAGQRGTAISILHRGQVHAFKKMLSQIAGGGFGANLREEKLPEQRMRPFRKVYQESLQSLRSSVRTKKPREAVQAKKAQEGKTPSPRKAN